jgi:hypothetical protein
MLNLINISKFFIFPWFCVVMGFFRYKEGMITTDRSI